MNKVLLFCASVFLLCSSVKAGAQDSFSVRAQRYIDKYYSLAIDEQMRSGIPAAVTLAQGVLETEAGKSELACSANNHFGIKCKADYAGEKFFHDDDAPKECFKMYRCAEDSYKDHSDYLKRNPRYAPLFTLSQTDYASWAVCLKKCGYATNPQYAQRLIKLIEDFKLQQYTYAAMDSSLLPVKPGLKPVAVAAKESKQPVTTTTNTTTPTDQILITTPFPSGKGGTPPPPKPTYTAEVTTTTPQKSVEPIKETAPVVTTPTVAAAPAPVTVTKEPVKDVPVAQAPKTESKHNIIVTDGPLPLQAKPGTEAVDSPETKNTPQPAQQMAQPSLDTKYDSGKVIIVNGLKAFCAYKGDVLLQYAVKYNIRYPHLLEINDLPDGPLEANMPIYLEKKLTSGTHARHTVREGESMYMISQMEGMQLKRLLALNMMDIGDEPAVGVILELQSGVFKKPALRAAAAVPAGSNMTVMLGKSTPPSDMVVINHTKPTPEKRVDTVTAEKPKPYVETVQAPAEKVATATPFEKVTPTTEVTTTTTATTPPNNPAARDTAHLQEVSKEQKVDTADELAALKAELDKVVYTDDTKLAATQPAKTVKPAITTPPQHTTVKPKKKKASNDEEEEDDEDDKKKGPNYYTIKEGETLGGIANRHNTTVKKLMQLNHIKATQIRAGKKLRIK